MSGDAKFWAARIVFWLLFAIDSTLVLKVTGGAFSDGKLPGAVWLVLIGVCTAAGLAAGVAYSYYKARRWSDGSGKSREQIEVETLANLTHAGQPQSKDRRQQ